MGDTKAKTGEPISVLFTGISEMEMDSERFKALKDGMVVAAEATSGRGVHNSGNKRSVLVTFNGTNPDAIIPFLEQQSTERRPITCDDFGVCNTDHDGSSPRRLIEVACG